MKIRWKLLILLLVIALAPLITSAVLHRAWTRRLGQRLATGRREILVDDARDTLQRLVDQYGETIRRDKDMVELAVSVQARRAAAYLADRPPPERPLIYAQQFDDEQWDGPPDTIRSPAHTHFDEESGEWAEMRVAYSDQAFFVVDGVDERDVADDMLRLSAMAEVYRTFRRPGRDFMKWQYTSLEAGIHTTYPAHGGYAPDYDPRKRDWYERTRDAGKLYWTLITDVTTSVPTLAVAQPLYDADGEFLGVTAIDVPMESMLRGLELPAEWSASAKVMFVIPGEPGTEYEGKLIIVAHADYVGQRRDWRKAVELDYLTLEDVEDISRIVDDAQKGLGDVRSVRLDGHLCLCAHGPDVGAGLGRPEGFPVIIVPYDVIVAKADEAEAYVLARITQGLQLTGVVLFVVVLAVVVLSVLSSRGITRPISRLADAAGQLAGGDFDARADIHSGDELQELGEVFNDLGPKLREREKLKHSLTLAMEVQQHLLPEGAPQIDGFDIAGRSVYCDETGGDYYDFIDLIALGPDRVGIALGDVSGHGIGAALLMASARAVLRSHAGAYGDDLGGLFDRLNRHLVRDTGDARFMTLFYGIVNGPDRSIRWSSGGHDPAVWYRRGLNEFGELSATGVPLGVVEDVSFPPDGPITVERGDVVVIGTDGIWEARNEAEELFGKDRLREAIAAHADESAGHIYAAILDAVAAYRGSAPQEDDVTLVVIKGL